MEKCFAHGVSLTICDCAGGGQIIRGTKVTSGSGIIANWGTMNIFGGTYCLDGEGWWIYNTGFLTVYDGTFGIGIHNSDNANSSTTRYGSVVIHNATIRDDDALQNSKDCTMTIYGGDFAAANGYVLWNMGKADIHGGKFHLLSTSTSNLNPVIDNEGTMTIRNAVVAAKGGHAINNDIYWNSSNYSSTLSSLRVYDGAVISNESTNMAAVNNRCYLYVYGGTISGYVGIANRSHTSGTSQNGGKCTASGGNISGTKCAILNSGNTSTRYENGVPAGKLFSRGILEISNAPTLGKVILEYPEALIVKNNCSTIINLEVDMTDIALGDTISTGNVNKLSVLNLLNDGYVLLYSYDKDIYLETNHCGATASDNLRWKLTPDGKLTIFGTGKMYDYSFSTEQPWNKNKTKVEIKEIELQPGITHIGSSAFAYLNGLTKIVIPEGVTSTGTWVFEGSDNLEEVHLPSTLQKIGRCFFATLSGTEPPAAVYYNGCEHQWANVQVDSTQPAPVVPICLPNENTDDGNCTTALTCSVCGIEITPAEENHTGGTATCTAKAECDVCGMAYGEFGHVPVVIPGEAPDCVNTGLTEGSRCDLCDAVICEQTVIPAAGHSYESVITPPTCDQIGVTTHTCSACGDSYTDNHTDALGHYVLRPGKEYVDAHTLHNDTTNPFAISGDWYASTNKKHSSTSKFNIRAIYDCTLVLKYKVSSERSYDKLTILVDGVTKKTASGEVTATTYTVSLKAGNVLSVQYSKDGSVSSGADTGYFMIVSCTQAEKDVMVEIPAEEAEPTCTEGIVCNRCRQTIKAALGHNMDSWFVVTPATCIAEGLQRRNCSRCDHFETEVLETTDHDYKAVVTEPTCTAKGYTTHICTCGDSYVDSYKAALGHTGGTATCKDKAVCTRCESAYGKLDAGNHAGGTEVRDDKVVTCTVDGYTGDTYCLGCNEKIAEGEAVTAPGHKMGEWETVNAATCTAKGSERRDCGVCDQYETRETDKLDHVYKAVVTESTCTAKGYTTHICTCGDSYVDSYKAALGHDMGEWIVKEVESEERSDCSRCDYYETRMVQPENILKLEGEDFLNQNTVWINGLPYPVKGDSENRYVEFASETDCMMATYTYHVGDEEDVHTQYPIGMKVYRISNGEITYIPELENLLQYSGSSIRITGKKGIRMITSLTKNQKTALTGSGLAGYKLVEYGTALCWSSEIAEDDGLVLGRPFTRSNYAFKRGVADPVFAKTKDLVQYTNVLVGFTNEQCKDDIAMRPYIILEDAEGEQFTIYGGMVYRSIGYIAYQNRKAFSVGSGAYNYVWDIIHFVYGDQFDADYKS